MLTAAGGHPCPDPDPGRLTDEPTVERSIVLPPPFVQDAASARLAALQPETAGAALFRLKELLADRRKTGPPLLPGEAANGSHAALEAARARAAKLAAQATGDLGPVVRGAPRPPRELIVLLQEMALGALAAAAEKACRDIALQLLCRDRISLFLHWLRLWDEWSACKRKVHRATADAASACEAALERQQTIARECAEVAAAAAAAAAGA